MKSKSIIIAMFIINIILVGIIYNNINKNLNLINKQVIKEMSESTQVTDLNNQINALNANHTEYMNYIQNCKTQIATALTNQNIQTSEDATLETMAGSIGKILETRTSDATATAEQVLSEKTAYVKGNKVTGTMKDNGAVTPISLNAGGTYTIPEGYHNGSGKVTANTLASQTKATATADNITAGKTAWVNGKLITGTNNSNNNIAIKTYNHTSSGQIRTLTLNEDWKEVTLIGLYCSNYYGRAEIYDFVAPRTLRYRLLDSSGVASYNYTTVLFIKGKLA